MTTVIMTAGNMINAALNGGIRSAADFARVLSSAVLQMVALAQAGLIMKEVSSKGIFGLATAGVGLSILAGLLSGSKKNAQAITRQGDLQYSMAQNNNNRNVSNR